MLSMLLLVSFQQHANRLKSVKLQRLRADGKPWEVPREHLELGDLLGMF